MGHKRLTAAVVLAAGEGRRMGASQPKQFLRLGGMPLFLHSLEFFLHLDSIDVVCLVLHPDALGGSRERAARAMARDCGKALLVAPGGARRQDSVLSGLRALPREIGIVLTHDSARPFPPRDAVLKSIAVARAHGGAILAAQATDTIKEADRRTGRITRTLDRSRLYLAQTPQTFRYRALLRAMEDAERNSVELTDEAMAFERLGLEVRIVPSPVENLKVTHPSDLKRAEGILR